METGVGPVSGRKMQGFRKIATDPASRALQERARGTWQRRRVALTAWLFRRRTPGSMGKPEEKPHILAEPHRRA